MWGLRGLRVKGLVFRGLGIWFGYCPHPVTVYIRGPIKGYIYPYYNYCPTVTEGGGGSIQVWLLRVKGVWFRGLRG